MKNKIAGALFGMALGDAMGMPDATDIAADHIKESYIEILKKQNDVDFDHYIEVLFACIPDFVLENSAP